MKNRVLIQGQHATAVGLCCMGFNFSYRHWSGNRSAQCFRVKPWSDWIARSRALRINAAFSEAFEVNHISCRT